MIVMMIELGNVGMGEVFSYDESLFAVLPFDFAVDKYLNLCLYSRNGNYDKGSEYWFDENTMVNSISLAKVKTLLDK